MSPIPRRASALASSGWPRSISSHSCHSSTVIFGCWPGRCSQAVTATSARDTTARYARPSPVFQQTATASRRPGWPAPGVCEASLPGSLSSIDANRQPAPIPCRRRRIVATCPISSAMAGLPGDEAHNPAQVLGVYASVMAPAVISADSPRFLGFIPAAPTKASLLFDMLISCASIQGISWLEAAGAVHAENKVLRLIADRAGLPESAGGCFVSGGSAGNLSALVVAREVAKRKAGTSAAGRRWRGAVGTDAHSSIINTLRILEIDPLTGHTDHDPVTRTSLT